MKCFKEFVSEWKDVEFFISGIGILISLGATAWGVYQSHSFEKNHFTSELLKEWNNDTDEYKKVIFQHYPLLADGVSGAKGAMTKEIAKNLDRSYLNEWHLIKLNARGAVA